MTRQRGLLARKSERGSPCTTRKLPHSAIILAGLNALPLTATELAETQAFATALKRAVAHWQHLRKRRDEGPFLTKEIAR